MTNNSYTTRKLITEKISDMINNHIGSCLDNQTVDRLKAEIKKILGLGDLYYDEYTAFPDFQLFCSAPTGEIVINGLDDYLLNPDEKIIDVPMLGYKHYWVIEKYYKEYGRVISHNHYGNPAIEYRSNGRKTYALYNEILELPEYLKAIGKEEMINFI